MLSASVIRLLSWDTLPFSPAVATTALTLWVAWWVWTFKLSPKLNPNTPKPLPYVVPFFGHVRGMTVNAAKIFRAGRQNVADTLGIWSLTVLGEEMYIVASPNDVLAVYREPMKLDADFAVKDVLGDFGVQPENVAKIFDRHGTPKHWMDYCHEHFKTQMHPGEHFNVLQDTFLGNIDSWLHWDRVAGEKVVLSQSSDVKTVSLWNWCHDVLVDSATLSFFGKAIYRVCPTIVEDFMVFDAEAWKLPYRYPRFAARDMYDAKSRGETAFAKFLALPAEERQDASWIVNTIRDGMADLGVEDPTQCGAMLFSLHRVANSNAYRLCFWALAHLMYDPELLGAIKKEIQPAIKDGGLDMRYLVDECPLLASFYEEILRWVNDPISIRLVMDQVTVGTTTLKPGRKLIMPYRPMHYDEAVFGEDAAKFNAYRFLNTKGLYRNASWRPFGGGAMYCPGRFLAKREVYMFVVLALTRFDMELAPEKQEFPAVDETIPAGGILPPVPGGDVKIRLRKLT